MAIKDQFIGWIRLAELQFRLACTVHVAVVNNEQTLDVPIVWQFGSYRVTQEDFGLRPDQAEAAASMLEHTAMLALVSVIHQMFEKVFNKPNVHENANIVAGYQISRLIRNAFAHSIAAPTWDIKPSHRKVFEIENVIRLDATNLDKSPLIWKDFGGPLAIFHFGRFVRENILEAPIDPNRKKPNPPTIKYWQLGRTILRKIDSA